MAQNTKKTGNHPNGENNGTQNSTNNGQANTNDPVRNAATNSNTGDAKSHEDTTN